MILTILGYTGLAISLPAFWLVLRYNMHIFQINGYKNDEHVRWLKSNWYKQSSVLIICIAGALACLLPGYISFFIFAAAAIIIIWYFNFLRKYHTKKKLVFTLRVKRLLIADIALCTVIYAAAAVITDAWGLAGAYLRAGFLMAGVIILAQPFSLLISNLICSPVERAISNGFIREAKNILEGMPELKIVGITGSYGKTSVKYYLQTLLSGKYDVLITPGNFNTTLGVVRTIRENMKPSNQIFLCEMGARHVGDIKEICELVHPDYGIITSVGPQHLETFFNMDNIISTKFELADAVRDKGRGTVFFNGNNEYIAKKGQEYVSGVFYTAGDGDKDKKNTSGYRAEAVKLTSLGTDFDFITPDGEKEHYQMRLIGAHNVINVAGAMAVAHSLGVSLGELKIPVRRLEPVAHRMEMKHHGRVTIIDDAYNSNPVGSKAAVETLAMFEGVRILVTPGMVELGDKEEEYNYLFGTYAAKCCDYIALVGAKHTEPIARGIEATGFPRGRCRSFERLEEAMAFAYGITETGHKYILLENDLPDNY